jgi:mono/diheme cytochrome c family protein
MRIARYALAGLLLALFAGCGGPESGGDARAPGADDSAPAPAGDDESPEAEEAEASGEAVAGAAKEAEQIFASRCFTCHGARGEGDGPGSAALVPKPRNFTDPTWQTAVTDDHIAKIIQYGGAAVGKSPTMPGNPDLMGKPEVVAALVAHVRSLRASE